MKRTALAHTTRALGSLNEPKLMHRVCGLTPYMDIFVQQRETGQFLGPGNIWVCNKEQAMRFETSATALEYCLRLKIDTVDIVLGFEDPGLDCHIKVG